MQLLVVFYDCLLYAIFLVGSSDLDRVQLAQIQLGGIGSPLHNVKHVILVVVAYAVRRIRV